MFELTPEAPSDCGQICPIAAGRQLSDLSRQYLPPEAWLPATPEEQSVMGPYSTDAVRTIASNYRLADVSTPQYMPAIESPTMYELNAMQCTLASDRSITPGDTALLTRLAAQRSQKQDEFGALSIERQQQWAELAKPVLDVAAFSLIEKNPELANLERFAAIMEAREEKDDSLSLARELVESTKDINHVHMLDHVQFFIARRALEACGGPMEYSMPRFFNRWGTVRGNACPHGERTEQYFAAENQTEQNR